MFYDTLAAALHYKPQYFDEASEVWDILMTLSDILLSHYERSHAIGELEEAVSTCDKALALCPPNHFRRPKLLALWSKLTEARLAAHKRHLSKVDRTHTSFVQTFLLQVDFRSWSFNFASISWLLLVVLRDVALLKSGYWAEDEHGGGLVRRAVPTYLVRLAWIRSTEFQYRPIVPVVHHVLKREHQTSGSDIRASSGDGPWTRREALQDLHCVPELEAWHNEWDRGGFE
ncbi:hypothetical protein NMY22_g18925 [Coprinellus aureogranulatus]|nr:hypothetical protein NMY22_g18925 [Coprinellus aureogranulatus]